MQEKTKQNCNFDDNQLNPQQQQHKFHIYENSDAQKCALPPKFTVHGQYTHQYTNSIKTEHKPRLKFRYQRVQVPHKSIQNSIFVIALLVLIIIMVISGYMNKLSLIKSSTQHKQLTCKQEYQNNRCHEGMRPALHAFCKQKYECYTTNPEQFYAINTKNMQILGQLIADFANGTGIYVTISILVMIYLANRCSRSAKCVTIKHQQYY